LENIAPFSLPPFLSLPLSFLSSLPSSSLSSLFFKKRIEKGRRGERGTKIRGEGKGKEEEKRALCFPKKIYAGFDKLPKVSFPVLGRLSVVTRR